MILTLVLGKSRSKWLESKFGKGVGLCAVLSWENEKWYLEEFSPLDRGALGMGHCCPPLAMSPNCQPELQVSVQYQMRSRHWRAKQAWARSQPFRKQTDPVTNRVGVPGEGLAGAKAEAARRGPTPGVV